MTALPPPIAEKCAKAIGQLGSANEGQVMAGARGLIRILEGAGLGICDLAEHVVRPPETRVVYRDRPEPQRPGPRDYGDWRRAWQGTDPRRRHKAQVARVQAAPPGFLSPWEVEFTASLARQLDQGRALSCRQETILRDLHARLEERFA